MLTDLPLYQIEQIMSNHRPFVFVLSSASRKRGPLTARRAHFGSFAGQQTDFGYPEKKIEGHAHTVQYDLNMYPASHTLLALEISLNLAVGVSSQQNVSKPLERTPGLYVNSNVQLPVELASSYGCSFACIMLTSVFVDYHEPKFADAQRSYMRPVYMAVHRISIYLVNIPVSSPCPLHRHVHTHASIDIMCKSQCNSDSVHMDKMLKAMIVYERAKCEPPSTHGSLMFCRGGRNLIYC